MKRKYIFINLVFFIVLIIIIASAFYLNYMQNLINENTFKNLKELTKQDAVKIENKLEEDIRILNSICNEALRNNVKTDEELFQIYNNNTGKDNFTRMAIMHHDGKTITSDKEEVDLSEDIDYFFSNSDAQISRSRESKIDMQEINIYFKKININNEDIVVMLIVETKEYERLFTNKLYNGNGYEFIITKEGEMIANSADFENTNNIYIGLKDNIDENIKINKGKIDEIENDIHNNISKEKILKINNHNYFLSYTSLSLNDWNLLILTPGNIIAEELNKVLKITVEVAIFIILFITIISIYIIISNIKKKEQLYKLAYIDPITKLGNYYYFLEEGEKILNNNKNQNIYTLVLDIEKFKYFNKNYGHDKGNKLIIEIGNKLKIELKSHKKIICRFSNDIFGIIIKTNEKISKIADNIFNTLSKIKIDDENYYIYPVIGIYQCKQNDNILDSIDKATIAHDEIIGKYNEKYSIFNEKMENEILKEHKIEEIMESAIENKEFKVYYQPKISLLNEKMVSAEALVRWEKNGEIISPGKFIPLFEKNGFILKLDMYIYECVCKDIKTWKEKFNFNQVISINISKKHFEEKNFIDKYVKIARKYEIPTNLIDLEITESVSENPNIDLVEITNKIKEKGFIVSLDDFGTGYSSLNMLQDINIDILKIDKSFIDKIEDNNKKIDLVKYIIKMAKELNIKTVAEGVENKEQINYLKKNKCDIVQGYYYSKPLRKEDFENYFKLI